MKDTQTRLAFIKARAEGKSYATIGKELGLAKATCASWEKAFKADISALKREYEEELYSTYKMERSARIRALGGILNEIDNAIAEKSLKELPLDRLLDLRLKYSKELKAEYIEPIEIETDNTLDDLLEQYNRLYAESERGNTNPANVKARLAILNGKREILYRYADEQRKEEEDPLDIEEILGLNYKSRLLRHEEESEA